MSDPLLIRIRKTLGVLAMSPERQIARVRELGVGNDELALEFDDVAGGRRTLVAKGLLSTHQAAAIAAVEEQLSKITAAGPTRWSDQALLTGEDWGEVRRLAQSALAALS